MSLPKINLNGVPTKLEKNEKYGDSYIFLATGKQGMKPSVAVEIDGKVGVLRLFRKETTPGNWETFCGVTLTGVEPAKEVEAEREMFDSAKRAKANKPKAVASSADGGTNELKEQVQTMMKALAGLAAKIA